MNITSGRFMVDLFSAGRKSDGAAGYVHHDPSVRFSASYLTGSGALQWSQHYDKRHTLSALEVLSLDLTSGLSDPFGDGLTFAEVKAVYVINEGATSVDISGNLGFTVPLPAGACFAWAAVDATGKSVANGSADTITITNGSGGSGSVRVVICGD